MVSAGSSVRIPDDTDRKTTRTGVNQNDMMNKKLKIILGSAIAGLVLSVSAQAGPGPRPDPRGEFERPDLEAIKERIAAQREALRQRLEERGLDLEALKAKREERRAKIRETIGENRDEIRASLKERRERMKERFAAIKEQVESRREE